MSATVWTPDGNRVTPLLPVAAMKTYRLAAPLATHWRAATCAEVDCPNWRHGWRTVLPAGSDLVDALRASGRRYTQTRTGQHTIEFVFEAGQACFQAATHRLALQRPYTHLVVSGDWRHLGEARIHTRAQDWVDDFATHQQHLADRLERG